MWPDEEREIERWRTTVQLLAALFRMALWVHCWRYGKYQYESGLAIRKKRYFYTFNKGHFSA
jgi:hypothetical protein